MAEKRDIKYINREFSDFRESLIEFAKNYFPDSYNDFDPTSPGTMFIEMAAYVGDVLSFYQDTQLQETFLQHAKNPSNLYSLAYMMGYRPRVTSTSEVQLQVTQRVSATSPASGSYVPNWNQAIKVDKNAIVASTAANNQTFITENTVDFKYSSSYDPTDIQIYSLEDGNPAEFLLTKTVPAKAGTIKTTTQTYTTAEKFATIEIEEDNIIGILDITDSDGNTWYEVPTLGQDTIFETTTNTDTDSYLTPNILSLKKVPRRFVTRFTSKGVLQIQFGAGVSVDTDDSIVPNPNVAPNTTYGSWRSINEYFTAYDPSNFLFTRTYGLAPSNTTLTIRYITGGGVQSNAPANSINTVDTVVTTVTDSTYLSTLAFNNLKPAAGGRDGDSVEELRQNSLRAFAEQQRAVTTQDYTVRALSLPPTYGSISKAYVTQDYLSNNNVNVLDRNPLALTLYTLAYDNNGKLTIPSSNLKANLKTYLSQYMMITDALNIKDAFIINIGVQYDIITLPTESSRDVLLQCNLKLQEYFDIKNWSINQPINLANVYTLLDSVKGVQTVKNIKIINKNGGNYSEYGYDVVGATKNNVVYPSYDPSIFEVKYPQNDIEGRITTL